MDVAAGERGGCRAEPGAIPLLENAQQSPSGSLFPSPPAFDLSPKAAPAGKRFSACGFILPIYTQTGSASISPWFFLQHQFQSSWLCPTPATDSNPAFDQSISLLLCLGPLLGQIHRFSRALGTGFVSVFNQTRPLELWI